MSPHRCERIAYFGTSRSKNSRNCNFSECSKRIGTINGTKVSSTERKIGFQAVLLAEPCTSSQAVRLKGLIVIDKSNIPSRDNARAHPVWMALPISALDGMSSRGLESIIAGRFKLLLFVQYASRVIKNPKVVVRDRNNMRRNVQTKQLRSFLGHWEIIRKKDDPLLKV